MNAADPFFAAEPRFWIAVISQSAADAAVAGGYLEVNQGKAGPLGRLRPGDGIACYSPRASDARGAPVQAFTALGRVADTPVYQVPQDHQPFRRAVHWLPCVPASVRPLIDTLGFIRNKVHWGTPFRYGFLRVPPADFACIAAALGVEWPPGTPAITPALPPATNDDALTYSEALA